MTNAAIGQSPRLLLVIISLIEMNGGAVVEVENH
jgi:hypothetical protein